jgi:RNA polymerase sigma factor (sigma-70 family)
MTPGPELARVIQKARRLPSRRASFLSENHFFDSEEDMAANGLGLFIRRLQTRLEPTEASCLTDRDLCARWVANKDAAAFEALVWRHGAMVLNTCRRLLPDEHDAEDAFQAAFLLFLRKAGAIRTRDCVAGWLYRVASRVALRAKTSRWRRKSIEERVEVDALAPAPPDPAWRELRTVLDEEVERLAERERQPFVLCYLEGKTNAQVARELGCPVGTVESRLARARRHLRARLTRRGLAPAAALLSTQFATPDATSAVPERLVNGTVRMADSYVVPPEVAWLAAASYTAMTTAKIAAAAVVLATGMLGAGTAVAFYRGQVMEPEAVVSAAPIPTKEEPPARPISSATLLDRSAEAIYSLNPRSLHNIRILERLGVLQARDGDKVRARAAFARVESIIQEYWRPEQAVYEWRELAKAQAEAGDVDAGLATADRIVGDMRKYTVQEMATALARVGNFKEAFRVVDMVGDDDQRDVAFHHIAWSLADAGEMREALKTADRIKSPMMRIMTLAGNQYDHMRGIAVVQAAAGDRAGARQSLRRATEVAEKLDKAEHAGRAWAWVAMAEARLGDFAAAKRTVERVAAADKTDRLFPDPNQAGQPPGWRNLALEVIAIAEAQAGRLDDALATARQTGLPVGNVGALPALAEALGKSGKREECRALLAEALKLAERIQEPLMKGSAYHVIATAQAEAGEFDAAEKTVTLRVALPGGGESLTRSNIAYAYAKQGDFAGALREAEKIKGDDFWKGKTLESIAQSQTAAGDERAALARADALTSPADKAATLIGIVAARLDKSKAKKRAPAP